MPYLSRGIEEQGEDVTSLFLRQSVYLAFFGERANFQTDECSESSFSILHKANTDGNSAINGSRLDGLVTTECPVLQWQMLDGEQVSNIKQKGSDQGGYEPAAGEGLEQERLEQQCAEQERLERERFDQERFERERREHKDLRQECQLQAPPRLSM
jgi:hypothetical protein